MPKESALSDHELDQAAEGTPQIFDSSVLRNSCLPALRAYKQAMSTLNLLRTQPPQHTFDPALASGIGNSRSIFSSFLPNLQGQGPIGTVVRIILKLHGSVTRISSILSAESLGLGTKKKGEEGSRKAIKVVDLLQHSAELGNMDALFTLAQVSLVGN